MTHKELHVTGTAPQHHIQTEALAAQAFGRKRRCVPQVVKSVVLALVLAALARAQAACAADGPGRIHGRVTAKATGEPVARARVYLWMLQQGRSASARTGADGRYEFTGLVLGPYHLRVQHPDYVTTVHGGDSSGAWSASLSLTSQAPVREANMALERGSSISGKLTTPEGAPAAGCYVYALALGRGGELAQSSWTRLRSRTDLMGQYTISGVPSGTYVVAAAIVSTTANQYGMERFTVYYGGAFSPALASRVRVGGEESRSGVDLQIRASGGLSLAGTVVDSESGLPIPRTLITVFHREATLHRTAIYTEPDGTYELKTMGPGPYQVVADARAEGFARESKWVDLSQGRQADTVDFELEMGIAVSGKIITDDGRPLRQRHIYAYVSPPASKTPKRTGRYASNTRGLTYVQVGAQPERIHVDHDLNFSVEGACAGQIDMHFSNLPRGYYVASIRHEDFDMTHKTPEFEPGQDIGGLEVVLSNRYGSIAGQLLFERPNRPVVGWGVGAKWFGTDKTSCSPQRTNSRGEFTLQRVPVGKHTLAVSTGSSYALLPPTTIVVRADQTARVQARLVRK